MKVLYAIQGTGNGHFSRAQAIIPELQKLVDLDIAVSGAKKSKIPLNYPIKYKMKGISYTFGSKGGFDFWQTFKNLNVPLAFRDADMLPVNDYDLVISDFEPVSAWSAQMKHTKCVHLSHQASLLKWKTPRPYPDLLALWFINWFIPCTSRFGFHYKNYDEQIYTPIIRPEVRALNPVVKDHYAVYLPFYSVEKLKEFLSQFNVKFHIFSKKVKTKEWHKNILLHPFDNKAFLESIETCKGAISGAGFMATSEFLFLGKKMLVIPMKKQFEQKCNAEALKEFGVPSVHSLSIKAKEVIINWLQNGKAERIVFPKIAPNVVKDIIERYA